MERADSTPTLSTSLGTVTSALLFPTARVARATGGLPPPSRPEDAEHGEEKSCCYYYGNNNRLSRSGLTGAHMAAAAPPVNKPIW